MSLLLTILVLQVAVHTLSTIGSKAINELLWTLFSKVPTSQSKIAASNLTLRREVVQLNREMSNTSAQDDFARWAKIRRQHDKKKDEYDKNARELEAFRGKFNQAASVIRWISTTGLRYGVQFWFSKQAMFWLPKGWVPHPVEWILSFPSAPLGSISINTWWIACASVVAMVSEAAIALWTLRSGEVKVGRNEGEKIKMESNPGTFSRDTAFSAHEKKEL